MMLLHTRGRMLRCASTFRMNDTLMSTIRSRVPSSNRQELKELRGIKDYGDAPDVLFVVSQNLIENCTLRRTLH